MAGTDSSPRSARNVAAGILTLVPVAAIVLTGFLWADRLPQTLPTQWSGDTVVSTQPTFVLLGITVTTALITGIFGLVSGLTRLEHFQSRITLLVTGLIGGICLLIWTVSANLGAADGAGPAMQNWAALAVGAGIFGFIPVLVARKPRPASVEDDKAEPLVLSAHETAAWSHTMVVPTFLWVALGLLIVGTASLWAPLTSGNPSPTILVATVVLAVVVVLSAGMSRVRITADHRGLRVSAQLLPFIVKTIELDEIQNVKSDALNPGSWGGWGYRVLPGRSAVVLRAGDSVVLKLRNGKEFAVTTDDSSTLASVLSGLTSSSEHQR